jgi:hypothetical protein
VRESLRGEVIIKVVNGESTPQALLLRLGNAGALPEFAMCILLAGDPDLANEDGKGHSVAPHVTALKLSAELPYEAPANSLTIIRFKGR